MQRKANFWNYFGLDPNQSAVPHRTVVTDCLALVSWEEINHLLELLFKHVLKNKLFYNHMATLLPDSTYHLACDGVWFHSYEYPHAMDKEGNNICPYCLPRIHNRGQENEKTSYLHAFVNLAFILPGGLQLPIYVYALKAQQVQGLEHASYDTLKQECELQAIKQILPLIKKQFPRLPITLLCDSLYANEPLLKLCKGLGWEYIIVRQVGSLKKVAQQCDELDKTEIYQKYCRTKNKIELPDKGRVEQTIKWFNKVAVGDEFVGVIRFEEIEYETSGRIAKKL